MVKYFIIYSKDFTGDNVYNKTIEGVGIYYKQRISYHLGCNFCMLNDKVFTNIEEINNHFDHLELYVEYIKE